MIQSEREKLYNRNGEFLSIGITEDGTPLERHRVFWENTSTAFNMKIPKVYISKEDLKDKQLMAKICEFRVHGCYIFCPLENYDFLKCFEDMSDLNIYQAYNLKDLSFLDSFKECRMLTISKAHLKHLNEVVGPDPLFLAKVNCLALLDCEIDDISYLKDNKVSFIEFVVYNPKNRNERERWEGMRRLTYYNIKES